MTPEETQPDSIKKAAEQAGEKPKETPLDHIKKAAEQSEPRGAPTAMFNMGDLKRKSSSDLFEIILAAVLELRSRSEAETGKIAPGSAPLSFIEAAVEQYVRLPAVPVGKEEGEEARTWRFQLFSSSPDHKPLGVEIRDEIIIGRSAGGMVLDLDLSPYNATELGVSRRHARLRPTRNSLLLTDMNSTNGTFCNGTRIQPGEPKEVKDNDTLSFGRLHFKLKITSQPVRPVLP